MIASRRQLAGTKALGPAFLLSEAAASDRFNPQFMLSATLALNWELKSKFLKKLLWFD